jgi:undecaprenyl-diphosphatase
MSVVMRPFVSDLRRHPADAVRVVLGLAIFAVAAIPVRREEVPVLEEDAFRFFNDLPGFLFPLIWPVMQLGNVVIVPVVAGLALAWRRPRMALDLFLSGAIAYVLAKVLKDAFDRGRPAAFFDDLHLHGAPAEGLGFVSGHAALSAALITAAAPWLGRRGRRIAWAAVITVMVSRVYVGSHLPLDVIAGAAIGWTVGAGVHLLLGAPAPRLSPETAAEVLAAMGFDVRSVSEVPGDGHHFLVETAGGDRLHVTAISREHGDTDLVHRGWRRLLSRWVRERGEFASPRQRVDHHAALSQLARKAAARTPEVVGVGTFGNGAGIIIERHVEGERLPAIGPEAVRAALPDLWRQVAALRAARIAHGDLRAGNVLVDDDGPWLLDFTAAVAGADDVRLVQDVAELIASLTDLVGADEAVVSAKAVLGEEALVPLIGFLERARLSGESREVRRTRGAVLAVLSNECSKT